MRLSGALQAAYPQPSLREEFNWLAGLILDIVDRTVAISDGGGWDPDHEDGGDAAPSLAAPENTAGSQVVYMRGNDQDREAEAPEAVLPGVVGETAPASVVIPWRERGNIIAAAGVALLDLVGVR